MINIYFFNHFSVNSEKRVVKYLLSRCLFIFPFCLHSFVATADLLGLSSALELMDESEGIVQELSGFQGQFILSSSDLAQLMLDMYRYQQSRDEIVGTILDPDVEEDCPDAEAQAASDSASTAIVSPCHPRNPQQRRFRLNFMGQMPVEQERARRVAYDQARFEKDAVARMSGAVEHEGFSHDFDISLEDDFRNYIDVAASSEGRRFGESDLHAFAFHRLASATADQRSSIYAELGAMMDFEEQIQFAARLGNEMQANYDFDRRGSGRYQEEVTCDEVLSGLLNPETSTGVYRDIHLCMARVLQEMGNEGNVYVLSYSARGSGHASMVVSNPDNPAEVHLVDYGQVHAEDRISGPSALTQMSSILDTGLGYFVWTPEGELAGSLPSEMGMIVNEVLGGDNQADFDPFVDDSRYQLTSVGIEYADNIFGNAFVGQLANGDSVFGVASYVRWNQCIRLPGVDRVRVEISGRLGASYHHRRIAQPSELENVEISMSINSLTYLLENSVEIPIDILRGASNLTLTPAVTARVRDGRIYTSSGRVLIDPDLDDSSAVSATERRSRSTFERTDIMVRPSVDLAFDTANQRLRASASVSQRYIRGYEDYGTQSDYVMVPDLFVGDAQIEYDLHRDLTVFMGSVFALREYGDSAQARVGAALRGERRETRVQTSFHAPTSEVRNGWMPGGARRTFSAEVDHLFQLGQEGRGLDRGNVSLLFRAEDEGPMWMTLGGGFRF